MNHPSAAAEPNSTSAGDARSQRDLGRDVSETRGEVRTLKWASALAFVAIVGTMGFFYSALETFHEGQKNLRETLGAIHKQTELLSDHLFLQDKRLEGVDGRMRQFETGLVEVNARLDQVNARLDQVDARIDQVDARMDRMDGRIHKVERGLEQVNGRLDRMDGRHEQMDARLGNIEDLLGVLVAKSTDTS